MLKTLSHVDAFAPESGKLAGISPDFLSVVVDDLLSMLRTWSKMGSRVCRVVDGPWSDTCICCVSLLMLQV